MDPLTININVNEIRWSLILNDEVIYMKKILLYVHFSLEKVILLTKERVFWENNDRV